MRREEMFKAVLFWVFENKDQGQQADRLCELMKRIPDMDLMALCLEIIEQPELKMEVRP